MAEQSSGGWNVNWMNTLIVIVCYLLLCWIVRNTPSVEGG